MSERKVFPKDIVAISTRAADEKMRRMRKVILYFAKRRVAHLQKGCSIEAILAYDDICAGLVEEIANGNVGCKISVSALDAEGAHEFLGEAIPLLLADGFDAMMVSAARADVSEHLSTVIEITWSDH